MINLTNYTLERGIFRVNVEEYRDNLLEYLEIFNGKEWIKILKSPDETGALNITFPEHSPQISLNFLKQKKKKIYFEQTDKNFDIRLEHCLEEENILHVRYKIKSNQKLELTNLGVQYELLLGKNPDFTWVPHICPKKKYVIGDHVFRSPVIIYKVEEISIAFIPDVKTLGANHPFKTYMKFDLNLERDSQKPYIKYGFGEYKPYRHVLFKRRDKSILHTKKDMDLTFRFYIIVFNGKSENEVLKWLNWFFWEKQGRRFYYESLEPQVVPFKKNVKEGFAAIFNRHNAWGEFSYYNKPCGGFWVGSWLGEGKVPYTTFTEDNYEEFLERFSKKNRPAAIFNNMWFLNLRSSYGMRYFGEHWEDDELKLKSLKMLNLVLKLPRRRGIFPSIVLPNLDTKEGALTVKGCKAWWYLEQYNIVDACMTMYWALVLSKDFNEQQIEVIEKSKELVNLIKSIQQQEGQIPVFIDVDDNDQIHIDPDLMNSACSASALLFLTEFLKITEDESILKICIKIVQFLEQNIIIEDRWHDVEVFYSCTNPLVVEYDRTTKSHLMNNMCIYWCAEALSNMFIITQNKDYLFLGERVLSILSLFQQVWDMPYISYNTFGGFGVQNDDAELSDARQALFVKTYLNYYRHTSDWEYMERGIAALRASWTLQFLPEYKKICPGNFLGMNTADNIDKGCISENYGHLGRDERIPGFIMFDWGVGSAAMATAWCKKHFGDLYVDWKNQFVFGIDGILIKKFDFENSKIFIECEFIEDLDKILIKFEEPSFQEIEIIINQNSIGIFSFTECEQGFEYKL